jgi:hypothetical protein
MSECKHDKNFSESTTTKGRYHCDDCGLMFGNPPSNGDPLKPAKTEKISVSQATTKSIRLTKKEKERAREEDEKLAKAERKKFIAEAAAASKQVEKHYKQLHVINQEFLDLCGKFVTDGQVLHRKFKDVVAEMRPQIDVVVNFFAHKPKGATLLGYNSKDEWSLGILGVTARRLDQVLNPTLPSPKVIPLLPAPEAVEGSVAGTPESKPTSCEETEFVANETEGNEDPELPQTVKNTKGEIIPEATWSVDETVRHIMGYVQSCASHFPRLEDRVKVFEGVAGRCQSEALVWDGEPKVAVTRS